MRILMLDIDTLRPDRLGCYGYNRNTSPNIDSVAQDGIRFNRYYCSDAPCLPSRAALVSGRFGIHTGAVGHGGTCGDKRYMGKARSFKSADDQNNLFQIFRKSGMHTVSVSSFAERHSAWWFNAGFNETYNVGKSGLERGDEVIDITMDWLKRRGHEENWFLHVHLWDPHTPYRAPIEMGNPFADVPLQSWMNQQLFERHLNAVGPHTLHELSMYNDRKPEKYPRAQGSATTFEEYRRLQDTYDCCVLYTDQLAGQIFTYLKQQNLYEDTAIIITSDHGENMGELGIYSEHATADNGTCHIPMIIKWPGIKPGIDDQLRYNLDLAPTLAELFSVEPYAKWDGKSYAGLFRNEPAQGWDSLVISQMAHVCQRSAIWKDWLYIRTYHDGFHLFDKEMLFNLKDDPHQQYDLKKEYPELCAVGAKILLDWQDDMMASSESTADPLWIVLQEGGPSHTVGRLPEYLEHLRKTGREEIAHRLEEKYL